MCKTALVGIKQRRKTRQRLSSQKSTKRARAVNCRLPRSKSRYQRHARGKYCVLSTFSCQLGAIEQTLSQRLLLWSGTRSPNRTSRCSALRLRMLLKRSSPRSSTCLPQSTQRPQQHLNQRFREAYSTHSANRLSLEVTERLHWRSNTSAVKKTTPTTWPA